ncbi:G-protein coupled receptor dmsr-1-like isoform X2 [Planococcus citri]|uniref:G-protein coupled receptor dmsr-1-like isoform X2 n=1 Tax=Planococcus citri TaxID=170843 RepID=UPI0031F97ABC
MLYSNKILVRGEPFCGPWLILLHAYCAEHICGYLHFIFGAIGSILNIFNIIVFTRKSMISPNNLLFANLAIVDLFCIIAYMPRSWHEFIRLQKYSVKEHRVYEWEMVSLHAWHIASIFHGVSIWLTIMLAVWRYIAIAYPLREREWCSMKNTRILIAAGYVVLPLIWIPAYFDFYVGPLDTLLDSDGYLTSNQTIGIPSTISKMQNRKLSKLLRSLHMTIYGIFLKIVPTVVLAIYSYKLIAALLRAKKRRQELTASMYENNAANSKQKQPTDRTTKLLLVVLALFFISEIPHGICCLLTAIYGSKFFLGCYLFLAEIFNTLTLFCTSVNFVIYYIMSQQFRNTFNELFCCKSPPAKKKPVFTLPETQVPYDASTRSSVTTLNTTRSSSVTTITSTHM